MNTMIVHPTHQPDPARDLVLSRVVDLPVEKVWAAWTRPEHILHWFTPVPWQTVACDIDLRPGGHFKTTMRSPEGNEFPNAGCYLEVIPNERLAWTSALAPGFRPMLNAIGCADIVFTAVISMEPVGDATRYTALAMHPDDSGCRKHAEMGFHDGWSTVLDQLVAYMGPQNLR